MNKELSNELLEFWSDLTSKGLSGTVREEIGEWCDENHLNYEEMKIFYGYTSWKTMFERINYAMKHSDLLDIRNILTRVMLQAIRKEFGEKAFNKILKCL